MFKPAEQGFKPTWAVGTCSNVSAAFSWIPLPQVAPICLEVLQWSDLRRAPKPGGGQQPDVLLTLRVSNAAMRGAQYQEEIINQVRHAAKQELAAFVSSGKTQPG